MGGSEGEAGDAREGQASCELYVAALGPRDDGLVMPLMLLRVSPRLPAINSALSPFPYNPNTSLLLCRLDSPHPRRDSCDPPTSCFIPHPAKLVCC